MKKNDLMQFAEEEENSGKQTSVAPSLLPWRILIVDDEQDVHSATKFALKNTKILGRSLEFLHATSSKEAIRVLQEEKKIAVILLDVVMETPNAGLDLIARIRKDLNNSQSRIILRTGQPNEAPEMEVIRDYDINDYRLKSELTKSKLYASLTTAVRSYQQIQIIEKSKKALDLIVRSSSELLADQSIDQFADNVLITLSNLYSIDPEGLVCMRPKNSCLSRDPLIISASGVWAKQNKSQLSSIGINAASKYMMKCLDSGEHIITKNLVVLYLGNKTRGDLACLISWDDHERELHPSLIDIFCSNVIICADNLKLVDRLRHQAYYDALTGLPNRNAITEGIDNILSEKNSENIHLAMVDIDNFAEINAALGQNYGDLLLKAIGRRIRSNFSNATIIGRVAGDTFALLGPADQVSSSNIIKLFLNPFEIGFDQQIISVTSGIVPLCEIDDDGNEAIKNASIVLKIAKNESRGQTVMFSRDMIVNASERLQTLRELRSAYEQETLFLAFQPKLNITGSKIIGFEALLRWMDNSGKFVPPSEFIPLAEQSGLIVRMGEWILTKSFMQLKRIHDAGWSDTHMSVNVSVAQLNHPDILEMLQRVIQIAPLPTKYIDLEITESIAMGDVEKNLVLLKRIRDLGFTLSIDDFGTGFSSLSYLQKMPINRLKIDQGFVRTSCTESGRNIVEMIVQLGKTLGLTLVGEGIETEGELLILSDLKCDEIQGYHFARPMPEKDLFVWLTDHKQKNKDQ